MSSSPNPNGPKNDLVYWLIALGLIFTAVAAPVGVLMIVIKLLDGQKRKGSHPYYQQQQQQGARTAWDTSAQGFSQTRNASNAQPVRPPRLEKAEPKFSQPRQDSPTLPRRKSRWDPTVELDQKGKRWTIWGGVMAAIGTISFLGSLGDPLYWLFEGDISFFIQELLPLMTLPCIAGGGLGLIWAGTRKRKQARRFRNYLAIIGQKDSVSISALASATGRSPGHVRDDLADMLDAGLFPQGFLDYGGDRLVLTGDGIQDPVQPRPSRSAEPEPETQPSQEKKDENAILAEIRAVNNAISNQKLSAQIDRVGVITAKILDYQKSHPDKAPQLHSFLSYYLPTTLKILRAYGQLEAQEISGENITAAMQRIEGMMDKVVEGFEKQLDLLFQGDAMDITTDVEVLERMLAKDGLSEQPGLTLGL